ncbi:MAG: alpha-L-fucosidase [Clostridia bacterium]|nr:alpha-L-fucosidase [Clostridia bacterium]
MKDHDLVKIVPSARQLALQRMEFYAFVHFGVNTFTDREWGDGTEAPAVFRPTHLDPDQWVEGIKSAGMKGMILTCKHHDGFCLWPSRYTEHSVRNSPCVADVVRAAADACRRGGIRFGVYLSPWDRNHPLYGSGKPYDDYFTDQLTELLTGYGDIFSVWFDGACGEGPNGKKQFYDWDRYYRTVRSLQPGACIHVCGPDIRWCGNEAGATRPSEWSVVPRRTMDTEKIASFSQRSDDGQFRLRPIHAQDMDLGSREILKDETDLIWYPAEVNTSIRPGWFWHESENSLVKPLDKLIDIYMNSVGGNATFLLNIPPDKRGLFHENDMARLREIGGHLWRCFQHDLLPEAAGITAPEGEKGHKADCLATDDDRFYFPLGNSGPIDISAQWKQPRAVRYAVIREHLLLSQRIERFELWAGSGGSSRLLYRGTTVGSKKIVPLEGCRTDMITLRITDSRESPALERLAFYD